MKAGGKVGVAWKQRFVPLPALAAVVVLVLAGIGVWLTSRGGGNDSVANTPSHHVTAASHPPNVILQALAIANQSATAKHLIPPSTCKAQSGTTVTCTHPAFGANTVTISTFPSLSALYAAYVRQVKP